MKYSKEVVDKIVRLIETDNYTVPEICKKVGIVETTFYEWQSKKAEFSEAIKKARHRFDDEVVVKAENSLIKLISGYDYEEKQTVYIPGAKNKPKIKEQKTIKKYVQPNLGAIIFHLTNKKPQEWKNRQNTDVTTNGKDMPNITVNVTDKEAAKSFKDFLAKE